MKTITLVASDLSDGKALTVEGELRSLMLQLGCSASITVRSPAVVAPAAPGVVPPPPASAPKPKA